MATGLFPGSLEEMAAATTAETQGVTGGSSQSSYKPIFSYANPSHFDPDPTGDKTLEHGRRTGQVFSRDDILELNVGGKIMSADQLRETEGGLALMEIARKNRQGRKGFLGGLSEGAGTDFVPFVADIASLGVSVANMSKMRDSLKKIQDGGIDSLTDQERVWVSLYEQDSLRNQQGTWGSTVGSIIRQAPAFALEFALTGGLHKLAAKGVAAVGVGAAKEGIDEGFARAVTKMTEGTIKKTMREEIAKGVARGAVSLSDAAIAKYADDAIVKVAKELGGGVADTKVYNYLQSRVVSAGKAFYEAYKNPKIVKQWGDFLVEYGKRGFMTHYDDILGDGVQKTVKDRLRDFAGVALIEAPIRGSLYATFDFAVANPLAAAALGADEAVTRSELMFSASDNKAVRDGAKFLSYGTALAEYASENAGGAFNALGNIVRDTALAPAAKGLVSRGLRAMLPREMGSFVNDVITKTTGGSKAVIRKAIDQTKMDAVQSVIDAADDLANPVLSKFKDRIAGRAAADILADAKLTDDIVKTTLTTRDKSFLGFWLADKMSATGATPDKIMKGMKAMGYDELVGEFMEERYNGFAQGLFGLDGSREESMGFMGRLAYAAKSALPETTGQGFAEIVAFAMPMVGRAMINRAYQSVGAGPVGEMVKFASDLHALGESAYGTISTQGKSSLENMVEIPKADSPESEKARVLEGLGGERAKNQWALGNVDRLAEGLAKAAGHGYHLSEVSDTVIKKGARMLLKAAEAVITGNPFALFNDQNAAIMYDRTGKTGYQLYTSAKSMYQFLFEKAARDIALERATEAGRKADMTDAEVREFVRGAGSREAIEARIAEPMRRVSEFLVSSHLSLHGAAVVTDDMIDREMEQIAGHRERTGNPMTEQEKAEFRGKFKAELAEVARNNMTWNEVGGQGQFTLVRDEDRARQSGSDMHHAVVRALHSNFGVFDYIDTSTAKDPRSALAERGLTLDTALLDRVLADDTEATLRFIYERGLAVGRTVAEMSTGKLFAKAKAEANAILRLAALLSPEYENNGIVTSITKGEDGKFTAKLPEQAPLTASSMAEVEQKLAGLGFTRQNRNIIETSMLGTWTPHAAAIFHPQFINVRDYGIKGEDIERLRALGSPYLKAEYAQDFAAATAEAGRLIADAKAKKLPLPEWETFSATLVKGNIAGEMENPGRRGQLGYMVAAGALNDSKNVYIPRRRYNGLTSLAEDVIENMLKDPRRSWRQNVFMMTGADGERVYHPAVQGLFRVVKAEAERYASAMDIEAAKNDFNTKHSMEQAAMARRLAVMFDPGRVNDEAVSKSVNVFGLLQGFRSSDLGGAAYYGLLTKIADTAGATDEAVMFRSLVSRFVAPDQMSAGMITEGGGNLAPVLRDLAPMALRDVPRPGMPGGALALPAETGVAAKSLLDRAKKGELFREGMDQDLSAEYAKRVKEELGANLRQGYFPEDIPELARQLASSMRGGQVFGDAVVPPVVETPDPADAEVKSRQDQAKANAKAAAANEASPDADAGKPPTGSIIEMIRSPRMAMFAFVFASHAMTRKGLMYARPANPDRLVIGNDDDLRKAFEFWKMWAKDATEDDFNVFKEGVRKVVKADGMANEDSDSKADETGIDAYADDAARDYFAKDPLISSFREAMNAYIPSAMGEIAPVIDKLYNMDMTKEGTYDEDSITALFDGESHQTPHKAMRSEEDFNAWVGVQIGKAEQAKDGPGRLAFLSFLQAVGFKASNKLLTDIRKLTLVGGLRMFDSEEGGVERAMGKANPIETHTSSGGARAAVARSLSAMTLSDIKAAADFASKIKEDLPEATEENAGTVARRAAARKSLTDKRAEVTRDMAEEVYRQASQFAKAFDTLMGPGNMLSDALREPGTSFNLAANGVANGTIFTYVKFGTTNKGMAPALTRAIQAMLAEAQTALKDNEAVIGEELADRLAGTLFLRDYQTGMRPGQWAQMKESERAERDPAARQRGPMLAVISAYASTVPKATVRRLGREGGTVKLNGVKSVAMEAFLRSPAFVEYVASKTKNAAAQLNAYRRAVYPSGMRVFWNVFGYSTDARVKDKTSGRPTARMVLRAARKMSAARGDFYVPLFRGDKTNILGLTVPMDLAQKITGKEAPTYNEVYRAAAILANMDKFNAKRAPQMVQGYGPALEVAPETDVTVVVPSDPNAPDALREATLGQSIIDGPALQAMKLTGEDGQNVFKYHGFGENGDVFMQKGIFIAAGEKEDPADTEAVAFMKKLARDAAKKSGRTTVVDSLDGSKEGRINSKFNGVLVNGKVVPAMTFITANPDATPATVVTWQDKGEDPVEGPLSQFLPNLQIRRQVAAGKGGHMVDVVSYTEQVSWRRAASLYHQAKLTEMNLSKNAGRDAGQAAAQTRLVAETLALDFAAAHPETVKPSEPRNQEDARLVASGLLPRLSDVFVRDNQMSIASSRMTESELSYAMDAVCMQGGGRTVDGKEQLVTGADSPHSSPVMSLKGREADFGGRTVRPASIALNLSQAGVRGTDLVVNEGHKELSAIQSQRGKIEYIRGKLTALQGLFNKNGRVTGEYVQMLSQEIMPMFALPGGKEIPAGVVYSFADLFDDRGFDYTAFKWGKDSPDEMGLPVLCGAKCMVARTPSGDPAAWFPARVYGPVSTAEGLQPSLMAVEKDATDKDGKIITDKDGKPVKRWVVENVEASGERSMVSADEALIRCHADILVQTGHDNDGDKLRVFFYQASQKAGRIQFTDASDAALVTALRAEVRDPDAKKAEAALARATRGLRNAWLRQAFAWWEAEYDAGIRPTGPLSFAAADAAGIAAAAEAAGRKTPTFNAVNPDTAADGSDRAKDAADARGTGVSSLGSLDIFRNMIEGALPKGARPTEGMTGFMPGFDPFAGGRPDDAQWRFIRSMMFARNNLLFDVMKNFGVDDLYGFTQPLISLHDAMLYMNAAAVKDMPSYVGFMKEWVAFAHGPAGRAIMRRWEAERDPHTKTGTRTRKQRLASQGKAFGMAENAKGEIVPALPEGMGELPFTAVDAITEAVLAYRDAGRTPAEEKYLAQALVRLYSVSRGMADVKAVLEPGEDKMNTPEAAARLRETFARATGFVSSSAPSGKGLALFTDARKLAEDRLVMIEPAFAGSYGTSELRRRVEKEVEGVKLGYEEDLDYDKRADLALRASMAAGAVAYAPAALKAKLLGKDKSMEPEAFKKLAEEVFVRMFDTYYGTPMKGGVPFLDNLVAPYGKEAGTIRPLAADDSASAMDAIRRSSEWLRDESGNLLDTEYNGVTYTGNDLWHILRIYTATFHQPRIRLSSKNPSFLAMFSREAAQELMFFQAAAYSNPGYSVYAMFAYEPVTEDGVKKLKVSGFREHPYVLAGRMLEDRSPAAAAAWYAKFVSGQIDPEAAKEAAEAVTAQAEENPPAAPAVTVPKAVEEAPAAGAPSVSQASVAIKPDPAAEVAPEITLDPPTYEETVKVLQSRNTILSNSEARVLSKKLGLVSGQNPPRVFVASERTDPVFFAQKVTELVKTGDVRGKVDALYLITKHDGLPIRGLLQLPVPKLIHFSMTTLGGTKWEPGVMKWRDLMTRVEDFIAQGLDPAEVTIRVDPIVPGVTKWEEVDELLARSVKAGVKRLRFSVLDGYSDDIADNIRRLYKEEGVDISKFFSTQGRRMEASQETVDSTAKRFLAAARAAGVEEVGSCAEKVNIPGVLKEGCLPTEAVERILDTEVKESKSKQRIECTCFSGKVNGLAYSDKCASSCVYCYAHHGSNTAFKYYNEDGTLKRNPFTETRLAVPTTTPQIPASVEVFSSVGNKGLPVTVRRDPNPDVGWIVSQGSTTVLITEDIAAKYWARRSPDGAPEAALSLDSLVKAANDPRTLPGMRDILNNPAGRMARAAGHLQADDAHGKAASQAASAISMMKKLPYVSTETGDYSGIVDGMADAVLKLGAAPELTKGLVLALARETRVRGLPDGNDLRKAMLGHLSTMKIMDRSASEDLLRPHNMDAYFVRQTPLMKGLVCAAAMSDGIKTAKQAYEAAAKIRDAIAPADAGEAPTASVLSGLTTAQMLTEYSARATAEDEALRLDVYDKLTFREDANRGMLWSLFTHLLRPYDMSLAYLFTLAHPDTDGGKGREAQDRGFGIMRKDIERAHEIEALWRAFAGSLSEQRMIPGTFDADMAFSRAIRLANDKKIEVREQEDSGDALIDEIFRIMEERGTGGPVMPFLSEMTLKEVEEFARFKGSDLGWTQARKTETLDKGGDTQGMGQAKPDTQRASLEVQDRAAVLLDRIMNDAAFVTKQAIGEVWKQNDKTFDELKKMLSGRVRKGQGHDEGVAALVRGLFLGYGPDQVDLLEKRNDAIMAELKKHGAYADIVARLQESYDAFKGSGFRRFADMNKVSFATVQKNFGYGNAGKRSLINMLKERIELANAIQDPAAREAEQAVLTEILSGWRSVQLVARSAAAALYHASPDVKANFIGPSANIPVVPATGAPMEIPGANDPEAAAQEAQVLDEHGVPYDPIGYTTSLLDFDAFYAGAVAPFFRGAGIRDILFNKDALTALPYSVKEANFIGAYIGTRSENGYLSPISERKMKKREGKGGAWYETDDEVTVTKFGRDKLGKQIYAEATGSNLTTEDLVIARMAETAIMFIVNSGAGTDSAMPMDGVALRFTDLPVFDSEDAAAMEEYVRRHLTLAQADRLAARAGEIAKGEMQTLALHNTLRAHRSAGATPAMMARIEKALQDAALTYLRAEGSPADREQAALSYLDGAKMLYSMRDSSDRLTQAVLAVPVKWVSDEFKASSAHVKLLKAGRTAEMLDFMDPDNGLIRRYREALRRVRGTAGSLGIMGASRFMHDAGTASGFFPGNGVHAFNMRRVERPMPGELTGELRKQAESLMETLNSCFRTDGPTGLRIPAPLRDDDRHGLRMLSFLIDLHGLRGTTPEALVREIKAGAWAGGNREFTLRKDATKWDVAKAVYARGVARLYEVAMNGGEVTSVKLGEIGLADFNRMITDTALANQAGDLPEGAGWQDIYRLTGALPAGMTASEHLAHYSQCVATATRYRAAFNSLLTATDEEGMPVIYMRPGANDDDTVPDEMWGVVARWWAQVHGGRDGRGAFYDETQSGKENARRLFDEIDRSKHADGAERGTKAGIERYIFETIKDIPEGFGAADKIIAVRPRANDDQQSLFDTFVGGEAAGIVKQVLAIPRFGRDDTKWAGVNRVLSWSKSTSVMASLFFPIATAVESPAAATGMLNTLAGMSERMSKLARKVGVVEDAPAMKEFFNMIGSDSDFLVDNMVLQTLCGLEFANRAKNMMDHDRTQIARDIKHATEAARAAFGEGAARNLRLMLEGAMEHSSEFAFEYVINATKMAVFAQLSAKLRRKALADGRWWDPVRSMLPYRNYINAEVGGIDPAMYAWMTPMAQKLMKVLMFSAPWTFGAWEAGGGGVLTQKLFGRTTTPEIRAMMAGRWLRMYMGVMVGVPTVMQLVSVALSKASDDDDPDDKWFLWQNEGGRAGKAADITPWLRHMANSHVLYLPFLPTWGELKKKLPESVLGGMIPVGSLIPAATGQEGKMTTTRKRRYYMNFGKQGWEVARWFEDPAQSFLSKMSMPAQKVMEGVLGVTPATGWEKPFADMTFWERWTSLDPEKSAALNLANAFIPFSVAGVERNPEAGALSMVGVVSKGISRTRASDEMARMFHAWADADTYVARIKGRPGAWTDLKAMTSEWMESLRMNGYGNELEAILKDAISKAQKPLYEQIHNALPKDAGETGDIKSLEEAARGMTRLDFIYKNVLQSIRSRDKRQNVDRSKGDIGRITDEMLREAFFNQSGATGDVRARQSATKGGDVISFLASDDIPATVLGYKVIGPDQLSQEDRDFFASNPEAAGFFDREEK